MSIYPRETVEFVPVTVLVDGVVATSGIEFCITEVRSRPVVWIAPVALGTESGVMIDGLGVGDYMIWAKVTAAPETIVLECGTFTIS